MVRGFLPQQVCPYLQVEIELVLQTPVFNTLA